MALMAAIAAVPLNARTTKKALQAAFDAQFKRQITKPADPDEGQPEKRAPSVAREARGGRKAPRGLNPARAGAERPELFDEQHFGLDTHGAPPCRSASRAYAFRPA